MNDSIVDKIVSAVLYEGYMLYPYRPSVKNRQRWTFGGVYPQAYSMARGNSDAWAIQTQCLVHGNRETAVQVTIRFLHLVARQIGQLAGPVSGLSEGEEPIYQPVDSLQVGDAVHQTWQEAVEREVVIGPLWMGHLLSGVRQQPFAFPAHQEVEPLRHPEEGVVGLIERRQARIDGMVEIDAEMVEDELFRVTVRVLNQSLVSGEEAQHAERDDVLMQSLVSTHAVLEVQGGQFLSLMDPPERFRMAAAGCQNQGLWPVLVGEESQTDTMLAAPIILYDYPRVAPESPGDLFDSTEIDELLTLRIMTLTDEEKRTMAAVDPQTRALLERTEALARQELAGLHGAVHSP